MRYRFTKDEITVMQNRDGSLALSVLLDGQYIDRLYIGYTKAEALKKFQRDVGVYPKDYVPLGVYDRIAIMEYEYGINDYVLTCECSDDGYGHITKSLIRYDSNGNSYFMKNKKRYYFSEFMRCDIGKSIKPKTTYYTDRIYGGHFTYEEMVEDAKKNYDYGDYTNFLTYQSDWWKENYKVINN